MKQRIHLQLSPAAIQQGNALAREWGLRGMSQAVERLLLSRPARRRKSFSERWQGKFKLAAAAGDERAAALLKKHA